jgi:epoxyqueuosine reductase
MVVETAAERSRKIREYALSLGFSHCGFAKAEALETEGARLRGWLDRGLQAGMGWMERDPEKRSDPRRIVDNAISVISVSMNYHTNHLHSGDGDTGKISRYAWGEDYHDVMGGRLEELEKWLFSEYPESRSRRYVDTGPVMDKAWAVRAGIGWLGKHSNVISRDIGSWIFLGEIITTLPLAFDAPIGDYCGSCTACIDACPTQAIIEPYVVDANRCISYLTIEYRGEDIPEAQRGAFDNWVFGCDVCQDVCPWNSFAVETRERAFAPRPGSTALELTALARISDEEFRERFRGTPVTRTKAKGMRRNARTVLADKESYSDR